MNSMDWYCSGWEVSRRFLSLFFVRVCECVCVKALRRLFPLDISGLCNHPFPK